MSLHKYSLNDLHSTLQHIPIYSSIKPEEVLQNITFFSDVQPEVLTEIAADIIIYEFQSGEIICRHGKFDERFFIILNGEIIASIPTENNPKFELFRLGPGDFFGEEILFSSDPRENTITASALTVTLSLSAKSLSKLLAQSNNIKTLMDKRYIERQLKTDLRRVPLFTQIRDDLFEEILQKMQLISVPRETIVFQEDDTGDAFYLIREGEVHVYTNYTKDKKLIAMLCEGQFFGEMSLLSDEKRNATIVAARNSELVRLYREEFYTIIKKDNMLVRDLFNIVEERKKYKSDVLKNPQMAFTSKKILELNKKINIHLDIITQCTVDTDYGSALLATLPGSRYPYVYPRDSACASRFLFKLINSPLKSGEIAFRLLGEIARFILHCQREDGYWGQRYGLYANDKGIYKQEDNVAHGVAILCRYLLAAKLKGITVSNLDMIINAIDKGAEFGRKHYYRNEIHLFYSTTSIHESAIEEGYSIWVNYAFLLMLRLIEEVGQAYNIMDRFPEEMQLKSGFEQTIENVFKLSERFVRRLKPNGEVDLRPDITLLSPFFFGTGMNNEYFSNNSEFQKSIEFVEHNLWDPDLGMLQRYLPFIEDPHTHIHAGNGPWIQYTAMLAQYYYHTGNIARGDEIIAIIDSYKSPEGYLCEHLTTPERFHEFKQLEWLTGQDFEKEFAPQILVPNITYDLIVEELNHMKNSYDSIEKEITRVGMKGNISFATPLMWSHAEYAMALLMRFEAEQKTLNIL